MLKPSIRIQGFCYVLHESVVVEHESQRKQEDVRGRKQCIAGYQCKGGTVGPAAMSIAPPGVHSHFSFISPSLVTYHHLACFLLLNLFDMLKLWKESAWKDGSGNQDVKFEGDSPPSGTCLDGPSLDAAVAVPLRTEVSLPSDASLRDPLNPALKHGALGNWPDAPRKRAKVQGSASNRELPLVAKGVHYFF